MELLVADTKLEKRTKLRLLLRSYCAGDTPGEQVYLAIRQTYPDLPSSIVLERLATLRMFGARACA